jgi:hypothetical protein
MRRYRTLVAVEYENEWPFDSSEMADILNGSQAANAWVNGFTFEGLSSDDDDPDAPPIPAEAIKEVEDLANEHIDAIADAISELKREPASDDHEPEVPTDYDPNN